MPRTPIITGAAGPVKTRTRVAFDPTRGQTVTTEWESAGDQLGGLANSYRNTLIQFDHTPTGLKSTLVATASGSQAGYADVTTDTWQLIANEVHLDVRDHPAVRAEAAGDSGLLSRVKTAVDDYEDGLDVDESWWEESSVDARLFRLLVHKVTSFPRGEYVLRHTTNISNQYGFSIAGDDNIELLYSTTQLLSEVTNSGLWAFPLPTRLRNKILNIEVQQESNDDLFWGWRKTPSQETTAGGNRIDISQEYQLNGWSRLLYSPL